MYSTIRAGSPPAVWLGFGSAHLAAFTTSVGSWTSSLLQMRHLSAMILTNLALTEFFSCLKKLKTSGMTSDCAQWNVNHAQPCCGAELSMACMRSRVAKCKHSVSCPAPTQLGNFCWCKWSRHKHCSACYYYIIESD